MSTSNPTPTSPAPSAERVINEGAKCIVGAFDSACTLAMAQVCEQRQVPLVVNIAAAPQLTEQGYKFLVRNFPTGGQLVTNGLKLIKDVLDATKLAPKTRGVPARQRHLRHRPARRPWIALFPTAGLPFRLLEFDRLRSDARRTSRSRSPRSARSIPTCVLVVTRAADAIKLVRDMVRQRFEPKGDHLARLARSLRRGILPGARAARRLSRSTICPGPIPKAQMSQALEAAFKPAHPNFRFAVDCFNVGFTFEALLVAADAFKRAGTANGRRADAGDPRDRHRRARHDRPADQVRRQGTEHRHPVGRACRAATARRRWCCRPPPPP